MVWKKETIDITKIPPSEWCRSINVSPLWLSGELDHSYTVKDLVHLWFTYVVVHDTHPSGVNILIFVQIVNCSPSLIIWYGCLSHWKRSVSIWHNINKMIGDLCISCITWVIYTMMVMNPLKKYTFHPILLSVRTYLMCRFAGAALFQNVESISFKRTVPV